MNSERDDVVAMLKESNLLQQQLAASLQQHVALLQRQVALTEARSADTLDQVERMLQVILRACDLYIELKPANEEQAKAALEGLKDVVRRVAEVVAEQKKGV
jgi:glycine cleavage system regulatory protein